ncbi:MAG TPA: universal stress protein [Gemmataceae bacterium]|nr:universal stress protein [Gemmataceae bacterium]
MFQSIFVPLDGSPLGEHALPWAVTIARKAKAALRLCHVHPQATEVVLEASPFYDEELKFKLKTRQRAYMDDLAQRLQPLLGKAPEVILDEGDVAEKLRQKAQKTGADLVVMSSLGRGPMGRLFLGSVTDELLRTMTLPMLIVHPHSEKVDVTAEMKARHILLPLDGSPFADQILEPAAKMAQVMGSELTLLRAVPPLPVLEPPIAGAYPPNLDAMLQRLEETQQQLMQSARQELDRTAAQLQARVKAVQIRVIENMPADEILQSAKPPAIDMVALATHGRRGLARVFLGSVSDKVIRGSHVPILVVRPKEKS